MPDSRPYTIGCYLSWCGADVLYKFADENQYGLARTFLNGIATIQFHDDDIPPNRSAEMTDYYVIEEHVRADFQSFMARSQGA